MDKQIFYSYQNNYDIVKYRINERGVMSWKGIQGSKSSVGIIGSMMYGNNKGKKSLIKYYIIGRKKVMGV